MTATATCDAVYRVGQKVNHPYFPTNCAEMCVNKAYRVRFECDTCGLLWHHKTTYYIKLLLNILSGKCSFTISYLTPTGDTVKISTNIKIII